MKTFFLRPGFECACNKCGSITLSDKNNLRKFNMGARGVGRCVRRFVPLRIYNAGILLTAFQYLWW